MTVVFSATAWLWLLLLPGAFLVWRWLQRSARAATVSSLLLWPAARELPARPRRFAWPQPDAGLLLGVAILAGLALAAAAPWWSADPGARVVAVVLDASPSMGAPVGASEERRFDVARRVAAGLLRQAEPARQRLLWITGAPPAVVAGAPGERAVFREALANATPGEGDATLAEVARSAAARVGALGGGRLVVISDFAGLEFVAPAAPSLEVETIAVGEALENAAVTGLTVAPIGERPGEGLAAATVVHAGSAGRRFALEARLDGEPFRRTELELQPHAPRVWSFAVPRGARRLEVRLVPGGALDRDDVRERALPPPLVYSVPDANGPGALSPALEAARAVVQARWAGAEGRPAAVRLVEGELPAALPARWIRFGAAERAAAGPKTVLEVVDDRARTLDRFFPLRFDAPVPPEESVPAGTVIARLGDRPAVVYVEGPGTRGVWSGIPASSADLARRGVLPLVLVEWTTWVLADGPSGLPVVEVADLVPAPPEGSRAAAEVLATSGPPPRSLRAPLLLGVATLIGLEAWRRLRRRHSAAEFPAAPAEPELPSLRLVAGGRR